MDPLPLGQPPGKTTVITYLSARALRHLAATLALTAGVEMKVVSEMLRHKTLAITADTYRAMLETCGSAGKGVSVKEGVPSRMTES
jgi:integrase